MPGDTEALQDHLATTGGRLYTGASPHGLVLAEPQHALLVLGPPRSGKTSAIAVPNTLLAPGPVIVTSTKPDILRATLDRRARLGRCWLLDPTGTVAAPPGVGRLRWSPVAAATTWDESLLTARALVGAARPSGRLGESAHWTERAEALLAPLLHAAHLEGAGIESVLGWVLRQDLDPAARLLGVHGAAVAADVLAGIDATDPRERSGIWSSAAGILAAYRSDAVLDNSAPVNFDPTSLTTGADTIYVCAPARHQELVAPIVVAFLDQARSRCYQSWAAGDLPDGRPSPTAGPSPSQHPTRRPLTLVLDEMANIAPIPDLPALVSEGGSQGVLTVGCLQDLSQARTRWGPAADGFLSLFGAKVVLPGIADLGTLDLVSRLGGEIDVPARSVSRGTWWSAGRGAPTTTWAQHRQRRLPVESVREQPAGSALLLSGSAAPARVALPPWWQVPALRTQVPVGRAGPAAAGLER